MEIRGNKIDFLDLTIIVNKYYNLTVYTTQIENENDLRNRIVASCEAIRNTPGIFERVRQSLRRRLDRCIMAQGGHFQQFI
ncbi:hypothetical protein ALC57_00502 [Trachymyrmex cornetzi]|uniref:Uncharacterized protein n=1 Tax=Trachymyrmex cornetzi TaxID=471704 RepID=A0A151JRQ9_9HYME|nr:hypothetical protein ALC57_00502 [Trachymyrmex cornetzi]